MRSGASARAAAVRRDGTSGHGRSTRARCRRSSRRHERVSTPAELMSLILPAASSRPASRATTSASPSDATRTWPRRLRARDAAQALAERRPHPRHAEAAVKRPQFNSAVPVDGASHGATVIAYAAAVPARARGFSLALPVLSSLLVGRPTAPTRCSCGSRGCTGSRPITAPRSRACSRARRCSPTSQALFADHSVARARWSRRRRAATRALADPARAARRCRRRRSRRSTCCAGSTSRSASGTTPAVTSATTRATRPAATAGGAGDPRPTIDQLMAWSPSFYATCRIRERALVMRDGRSRWTTRNPSLAPAAIQNIRGDASSLELFHRIFVPTGTGPRRARRSSTACSRATTGCATATAAVGRRPAAARRSHGAHRRAAAQAEHGGRGASCASVDRRRPTTPLHNANTPEDAGAAQLYNEVVAAAFICGTSRIAVLGLGDTSRFVTSAATGTTTSRTTGSSPTGRRCWRSRISASSRTCSSTWRAPRPRKRRA